MASVGSLPHTGREMLVGGPLKKYSKAHPLWEGGAFLLNNTSSSTVIRRGGGSFLLYNTSSTDLLDNGGGHLFFTIRLLPELLDDC